MVTMNISLANIMKSWVVSKVDGGQYANYSDYMRDLIRRDQNNELINLALADGENSGVSNNTIDNIEKGGSFYDITPLRLFSSVFLIANSLFIS